MNTLRFTPMLLATVLLLAACSGGNGDSSGNGFSREDALRPREVSVIQPERGDFSRTVRTTGSLQPRREASIRALAEGPITLLSLDVGDTVKKGDVLFEVRADTARLGLASAEAALATAEALLADLLAWSRPEEVARLEAIVAARQAEADRLYNERSRARRLLESGTVTESQWDSARAAALAAEAQLDIAREDLAIANNGPTEEAVAVAQARVSEARAALDNARQHLSDTRVLAPFDGVILARHETQGGYANRGDEVLRLADLSVLEAEMYIPERFASDIHEGLEVQLRLQGTGEIVEGVVGRVNRALDPRTRNFLVKVAVENPSMSIKAGAFAVASIELDAIRGALALPRESILREEGHAFVWIVQDGRARRRDLVLGAESGGKIEIRQGIAPEDQVVLDGRGAVAEGVSVEVAPGA